MISGEPEIAATMAYYGIHIHKDEGKRSSLTRGFSSLFDQSAKRSLGRRRLRGGADVTPDASFAREPSAVEY